MIFFFFFYVTQWFSLRVSVPMIDTAGLQVAA